MKVSLSLVAFALAVAAQEQTVRLHHRFIPSRSGEVGKWSHRGDLQYDLGTSVASFEEASTAVLVGAEYEGDSEGWYQLGVEADGEWVIGSTRACFLAYPKNTVVNLFIDDTIRGITLHPTNAPPSGECSPNSLNRSMELPHKLNGGKIIVKVQTPSKVYAPGLAPPPPVDTSTGQPAAPVEEKSFLAKYWLPLLGVTIFLVGQFGPEPPKEKK